MKHRLSFSGRLLLPMLLIACSGALAMPPHPDVLARIANGQQTAPYYLAHHAELLAQGVDNPKQTRTVGDLLGAALDQNYPILLILVDFSDNVSHVAGSSFDNLLFGNQTGSLKNFYQQVTYGNLTLVTLNLPSALGWARAPQTYAYYVNNQNGFGTYPHNAQKLVEDVVTAVDPFVDFSRYDTDGDGYVEGLFIAHAGRGAEYTGSNADIWSHAWGTYNALHVDGVWVRQYSMEPEYWAAYGDMTCGVYAHEMGHAVFGLPDLYDTDYSSEGLGRWSLMAGGSWNGTLGNSPAHPDAWCKIAMGIVTPTIVSSNLTGASIPQVETNATIYRLWTNGAGGSQYMLVENRQRTGYDTGLPASGLLIYHIDDGAYGNTNQWWPGQPTGSHYQVALEQADGLWQLEHNINAGDGGDPYPGSTNNHTYDDTSTPDSKSYAQASTNVAVRNIGASGATMTADLLVGVGGCTPPPQVTGTSATSDHCNDVLVAWTDVSGETGYRVYRNGTQMGSDLAANTTSYSDASGTAGTSYNYTVAAFNGSCVGTVSAAASGSRMVSPAQVTGVAATTTHCGDVAISWTDVSGESGYRVLRNGVQVGSDLAANTTSYIDGGATPGTVYGYTVTAFNASCSGPTSSSASGLRLITPAQVTGVAASTNRCSDVQITWSDVSGEAGYRVLRDGIQLGSDLAVNTTSLLDANAAQSTTYNYSVLAFNGTCLGTVSATASGSRSSGPAQVTGVTASTDRCADVLISWTAMGGATGYRVYRNGTQIGSDLGSGTTSYNDAGANPGTSYTFTVAALNGTCLGAASSGSSGSRLVTPAQVASVNATTNHCNDITVTWSDLSNETGYRMYRNGSQIGSDLTANTTSYVDASPTPGVNYSYTIAALNGACIGATSAASIGLRATTPAQVSGVSATTDRCSDVRITWTDIGSATAFRVFRNGSQLSVDLVAHTTSFLDSTGSAGISYSYAVCALNGSCVGALSNAATGMRATGTAQVSGVTVSSDHCGDVTVAWSDLSNETGYRVFRGGVQVGNDLAANTVTFVDGGAVPGTVYGYSVAGLNGMCSGMQSLSQNGVRLMTPGAVTGPWATTDHCLDIVIVWNVMANATSYQVFRNGTQMATLPPASAMSFTDTTAAAGVTYNYTISAANGSCQGPQSTPVAGARIAIPPQVTGLTASVNRCSDIHVSWPDVSNETGYRLSRNGTTLRTFPAGTTDYFDTTVTGGTTYNYVVQAFNGSCDGVPSVAASGSRLVTPNQVTGATASMDHCTDIQITWNDVANAGGFRVLRNGVLISGDLPAHTVSFTDSSANPGTNYGYTIVAFSGLCIAPASIASNGLRPPTPSQVVNVSATQNRCSDVQVTWTESAGAIGYRLYRNGTQIGGDLPTHSISFADGAASAGVPYDYTVRAFSGNCLAPLSASAAGLRMSALAAVLGVVASDDHCGDVVITWSALSDADSFQIRRNGTRIGSVSAVTHSFTDAAAAPGTYAYRIVAYNRCGAGDSSGFDTGTRRSVPLAVNSVTASRDRCADILLNWNPVSGANGYSVWRESDSLTTVTAGVNSFTDPGAQPGVNYNYRVRAFNDCGGAALSSPASGWRTPVPAVVLGVSATDDRCDSIVISWSAATGASGYQIYQDGTFVGSITGSLTRFAAAPIPGTHTYAVSAQNACGSGGLSATDNGTRWQAPGAPTNLTATNAACGHITLTWSAAGGNVNDYQILRDGAAIDTTTGLSFTDIISGAHSYQVRARSTYCGSGSLSQTASGVGHDLLPAVTSLTATVASCTDIQITWAPVAGALGYVVYRGSDSIGVTDSGTHLFDDYPAAPGTYAYHVTPFNVCGNGTPSNSVNGTRRSAPDMVSGLSASQFECQGVLLAWADAPDETSYTLFRNGDSLTAVTANDVAFADSSAVPGVSYEYTVRANNDCGVGAVSAAATGMRRPVPAEVTHVTATNDRCDSVIVTWIGLRGDLVYQIFRDSSSLGETSADVMRFADTPPVGEHVYSVRTHNTCGSSLPMAATGLLLQPAAPPTNVIASDTLCGMVAVTWSNATGAVNDYEIYRNGATVGTVSSSTNHYVDTVAAGEYTYAVRARGACGDSPASDTDNGTCHEVPGVPPGLTVPTEECDHVQLSWTAFRGTVQLYLIYRDGILFDSTASITYVDTTLNTAGQHSYRITARDPYCGESAPSAPTTAGLLPLTRLTGQALDTVRNGDTVRVSLDHCTGVTGDSLFLSLHGSAFEYVAAYAPVQNNIIVIVPRLDDVYTPQCRILLISRRGARADSILSPSFVIYSPIIDAAFERQTGVPQTVFLDQNYPNPFNPTTTIRFGLPRAAEVAVEIYDVLGRKLATLMSGYQQAGMHQVTWNCAGCATGVYFVRMRTGSDVLMRKMMLLK